MANEQEDYQGKLILKPMKLKIVQTSETKKFARLEAFTVFENPQNNRIRICNFIEDIDLFCAAETMLSKLENL